jgi:hypothetical protein
VPRHPDAGGRNRGHFGATPCSRPERTVFRENTRDFAMVVLAVGGDPWRR